MFDIQLLTIPYFLENIGNPQFLAIIGIIIPSWAILMILLERNFPYTKGIKLIRRGFWMDLFWYTFTQSKILEIIIFSMIIIPFKNYIGLGNSGILNHWNFFALLAFFFVTHDFYIYWFHRWQHSNKWLWRTHEAHHSCREVDWLAGSRSHFLEILINQTIEFLPIFLLLDSYHAAFVFPAKALLDALWGMWIHANVNVNSGKLQYIINGPEMHQWHHANHKEVFYKNFSTKIAAWDWIFGTAFLPNLKPLHFYFEKPKMFGLPYAYPKGYFSQLWFALHRFSISNLEKKPWYTFILNARKSFFASIFNFFKGQNIFSFFVDDQNKRYDLDEAIKTCPKCSHTLKYFYEKDHLAYICEKCETNTDYLDKFD